MANRISTAILNEVEPKAERPLNAWPITIELSAAEIPITAPIDVEKFLAGDTDVCSVVAKVPEGWSYNGYYFTPAAVQDIANTISSSGITGGCGHVESDMAFGEVAIVWLGATYRPDYKAAFIRGYVNPERPDLKRLIRAGVINRVSTDGYAEMESNPEGDAVITSFNVVSLDLVPRLKNGTESGIAAKDMLHGGNANGEEVKDEMTEEQANTNATDTAGTEGNAADNNAQGASNEAQAATGAETDATVIAELRDILSPLGDNPRERISALLALEQRVSAESANAAVETAIRDMVEGEDARALVRMLVKPAAGDSAETAKARVNDCLNNPELKRILAQRFADNGPKGAPAKKNSAPNFTW